MLLPDDLFVARAAPVLFDGLILRAAFHFTGEHPERHIDALDLLDVVVGLEGFGKKKSSFVVFFERADRLLLVYFEGDHIVRAVHACELSGDDRRISAVGAARRRSSLVTDQFRAAGRAVVGAHVRCVAPPTGNRVCTAGSSGSLRRSRSCRFSLSRFLVRFCICRRCALILICIQCFDFLCSVSAAAVFTFQFPDIPVKFQRPRTGRALVNCDLLRHDRPPFCCRHLNRYAPAAANMPKNAKRASTTRKHQRRAHSNRCTPAVIINSQSQEV